jgi:hypothetical protein
MSNNFTKNILISLIFTLSIYSFASDKIPESRFVINHVVTVVKNLNKAIKNFQSVGFLVQKTGEFEGGVTVNAHIPFKINNCYIEIFAPGSKKVWNEFHTLKKEGKLEKVLDTQNIIDARFLKHISGKQAC